VKHNDGDDVYIVKPATSLRFDWSDEHCTDEIIFEKHTKKQKIMTLKLKLNDISSIEELIFIMGAQPLKTGLFVGNYFFVRFI
jgi:hypothetical protein